jgi:hypothetical protein
MPLATTSATDELAYTLASLSGLTPDEVVAAALRAELDRQQGAYTAQPPAPPEPSVEEILANIRSYGPWDGPTGAELIADLYDAEGLPR